MAFMLTSLYTLLPTLADSHLMTHQMTHPCCHAWPPPAPPIQEVVVGHSDSLLSTVLCHTDGAEREGSMVG